MTTTYDQLRDETTIVSNVTVDSLYSVTGMTSFSVITTLTRLPDKGSVGIKVTAGPNVLYYSVGPYSGVNVISPPLGTTYLALEWSNTDSTFRPFISDDGVSWTPCPLFDPDTGESLPYPTFGSPEMAGIFFQAGNDPLYTETVVFGAPRVLNGTTLVTADSEVWSIPVATEDLKAIGTVPPTQPDPVSQSQEAIVHALVGAPFGDLEFDVGKSVGWLQRFVDDIFVTDVNLGTQRYWVINWSKSFSDTYYKFSTINFFKDPVNYRKGQWADAQQYAANYPTKLVYDDNDWVVFLDAHEGLSIDNRSKPDDYLIAPFASYMYREIARANAAGKDRVVLPFFVFLRHDHIQNVSQSYTFEPGLPGEHTFTTTQSAGVPYYLPYTGLTRMFKVSALKNPAFDWSLIDKPVAIPTAEARIGAYYQGGTVGSSITTPDPYTGTYGIPATSTVVMKVRGPVGTGTANQTLVGQYEADPTRSWAIRRSKTTASGAFNFTLTQAGTSAAASSISGSTAPIQTGQDEYLAVSMVLNGTTRSMTTWRSSDQGATWTSLGNTSNATAPVTCLDVATLMRIGSYGFNAAGEPWDDRIYWIEMWTGASPSTGTLLWRWDAEEVPAIPAMALKDTLDSDANADGIADNWEAYVVGSPTSPSRTMGANYQRFRCNIAAAGIEFGIQKTATRVPVTVGKSYVVSGLFAGVASDDAQASMWSSWYNAAGAVLSTAAATNFTPTSTPTWTRHFIGPAPAGAASLRVIVRVISQAGANGDQQSTIDVYEVDVEEEMTYTDPRGRNWTLLSASNSIVRAVPPAVKLQVVSYAYAHWQLYEPAPGDTTVPPLSGDNDDGWKQRCIISQVLPITGLPVGSATDPAGTWVAPIYDPPGKRGPWAFDVYSNKVTDPDIPLPPPPIATEVDMVRAPMYDLVFRLNVRDGVWYAAGGVGNTEMVWDEAAGEFVVFNPGPDAVVLIQ